MGLDILRDNIMAIIAGHNIETDRLYAQITLAETMISAIESQTILEDIHNPSTVSKYLEIFELCPNEKGVVDPQGNLENFKEYLKEIFQFKDKNIQNPRWDRVVEYGNKCKERLTYFISYLNTKIELKEEEQKELEKELSYITKDSDINLIYNYEQVYAFVLKYKKFLSIDEVFKIFNTLKINITPPQEEVSQEVESNSEFIDSIIETPLQEPVPQEQIETIAAEIAQVGTVAIQQLEKELTPKKRISHLAKLYYADSEEDQEKYIKLLNDTINMCKTYSTSEVYKLFSNKTNIYSFEKYKAENNLEMLKLWLNNPPTCLNIESFEQVEYIIKCTSMCQDILYDYEILNLALKYEEIEIKDYTTLDSSILTEFLQLIEPKEVEKAPFFQKNMIILTPDALKNALDSQKDLFFNLKKFIDFVLKNDQNAIIAKYKYKPLQGVTLAKPPTSSPPIGKGKYRTLGKEFVLEEKKRILGCIDGVAQVNRDKLADKFGGNHYGYISVHNIIPGDYHQGQEGSGNHIGQYGYIPYLKCFSFFSVLTKKEEWTDEELEYVYKVLGHCDLISRKIISNEKISEQDIETLKDLMETGIESIKRR